MKVLTEILVAKLTFAYLEFAVLPGQARRRLVEFAARGRRGSSRGRGRGRGAFQQDIDRVLIASADRIVERRATLDFLQHRKK